MNCGVRGVCTMDQVTGAIHIVRCRWCPDLCGEGRGPVAVDGPRTSYCGDGPLQHVFGVCEVQGLEPDGCILHGLFKERTQLGFPQLELLLRHEHGGGG